MISFMAKKTEYVYYRIDSESLVELAQKYIQSLDVVHQYNLQLIKDLGVKSGIKEKSNIVGVVFEDKVHPEFTAPNQKGVSYPKKNTDWKRRFDEAPTELNAANMIEEYIGFKFLFEFNSESGKVSGSEFIGDINLILNPAGFLSLPRSGVYGFYMPDIVKLRTEFFKKMGNQYPEENIFLVDKRIAKFDYGIPGATKLTEKDWLKLVREEQRLIPITVK